MRPSPLNRTLGFVGSSLFLLAGSLAGPLAGCSSKSGNTPSDAGGGGGGSGGNGGGDAAVETVVINPLCFMAVEDVLSDFTSNNGVMLTDGRRGGWYTYADKSGLGTLTPPEGGAAPPVLTEGNPTCSGPGSLHVKAINFVDWGAATGVDWMPKVPDDTGAMVKGVYDASRYRGVAFWAKAAAPVRFVQVKFNDPWTDIPSVLPIAERCVFDATMPDKNCSPYIVKFGYGWVATGEDGGAQDATVAEMFPRYADYKIDTEWKRFEILFADTRQDSHNVGQKSPGDKLDTSKLMGMAIQVNSDHSTMPPTANDFEIWIDDVTFIP